MVTMPLFVFSQNAALGVLETLNKEFRYLQELQIDYLSNLVHHSGDAMDGKSQLLKSAVAAAVQKIELLPTAPNDNGLKKIAIETFMGMDEMTEKDYTEIIQQKAACIDCYAAKEIEYKEMKAVSDEVNKSFSKMQQRLESFAKENNITLVDTKNEFDIIIIKVNRINDYLQLIELCVARAHYASEAVIKNFDEENPKTASVTLKTMKKELKAAFKQLKNISPIKEDAVCLKKAELLLAYYQQIADEIYPEMLSAYDKKGVLNAAGANTYNKNIDKINRQLPSKKGAYDQSKADLLMRNVPKPAKEYRG